MDALRKIYQRAVTIPLENVEQLWQEYERFENGLNHTLVSFLSFLRFGLIADRFTSGQEVYGGVFALAHASAIRSTPIVETCRRHLPKATTLAPYLGVTSAEV